MKERSYAVVTADVIGSRMVESFLTLRDQKLQDISERHLRDELILSPYTVTVWDEFQVILQRPEYTPRVLLDLRRVFYPLQLWIGVGIGAVSEAHREPVNLYAGGEAFERARMAADRLKKGSAKYRIFTSFESGNPGLDTIANTIYHLHDTLIEGTTGKQWMAINAQFDTGSVELTAKQLGLDISTVSRSLKRGYYWNLVETIESMEGILKAHF